MTLLTADTVTTAISELVAQPPSDLDESRVYACSMDDGDETTLELRRHAGEDHVSVSWYVPIKYMEPATAILPDDNVTGDPTGLPVDNQWELKSRQQAATTVSQLGDEITTAFENIRTGVKNSEYPTSPVDSAIIILVHADAEEPYCTLGTSFRIQ